MEAYDLIGVRYYYLNNIEKAQYYHDRMMKGKLQRDSATKRNIIGLLDSNKKVHISDNTIFDDYKINESFIFPHEDQNEIER